MNNLTPKQYEVLEKFKREQPRITILSGAKRSGKTFLNNLMMLSHITKFQNQSLNFIIIGATIGSVWRNVLNDWELLLNKQFKIAKDGSFKLFGNNIYVFGGENAGSWKKMRGMTSAGTYINEATALHKSFITEAFSRTSHKGARIFIDTNPDNPAHYIKKEYIDHANEYLQNGQLNIMVENFRLDDNVFLNQEYVESIKKTTPKGASYDRDILGLWVAQEGIVYADFSEKENIIKSMENIKIKEYFIGVDWGFEHYGTLVVIGMDKEENYYIVEIIAKQFQYYEEYWKPLIAQKVFKYKASRIFCDSARAEYVKGLLDMGIYAENAKKDVKEGIDLVGGMFKRRILKITEKAYNSKFKDEIYSYVWGKNDEPVKENDDVLDAVRYVLYSLKKDQGGIAYFY